MADFRFHCSECGLRYREDELRYVCPSSARQQEPGRACCGILEVQHDELQRSWPEDQLAVSAFLGASLSIASRDSLPPRAVGGVPVAEAAGIEAVLAGLRAATPNDAKLVTEAGRVFDSLSASYQQDNTDE